MTNGFLARNLFNILGWPKSSFGFFWKMVWKNSRELFRQLSNRPLFPLEVIHKVTSTLFDHSSGSHSNLNAHSPEAQFLAYLGIDVGLVTCIPRSFDKCAFIQCNVMQLGPPGGSDGKESPCNAGDLGLISWSRRSPGGENGNPLQYSCLGNPMEEEPGGLQSMGSHKSQTWLGN